MKIFARILLGIFVTIAVGFSFLLLWVVRDLEPQYRKVTEEPLADAAYTLASLAAVTQKDGMIDTVLFERMFREMETRPVSARIYDFVKQDVDLHVYITDRKGIVVFDSHKEKAAGADYSRWNDVHLALLGGYGSRTTRIRPDDPASSVMYVAVPIIADGRTLGVLSVGKPTTPSNLFVAASKRRILIGGLAVCLAVLITTAIVSGMVTRPIKRLTEYTLSVKEGKRTGLPDLGTSEIMQLGTAFDEMRDALEGKQYVEHYVQTLTHEIKSPLSAIQGAAELLEDEAMEPQKRQRFLQNIGGESKRIRTLVDKLLLLSSLETRKTGADVQQLDMKEIIADVLEGMAPVIEKKRIRLEQACTGDITFPGEEFLVRHAVVNIVQNAVEFTPAGGTISVIAAEAGVAGVVITVEDAGPGIPFYALDKIFERFYSLKRPDTGKKSSGLGLSLVRQIMALHNGHASIRNRPRGGTAAVLEFPKTTS
jgi:two-component system sensor histidine kinase CreC